MTASTTQISDAAINDERLAGDQPTAEESSKSDLWIFREGRKEVSGPAFLRELREGLAAHQATIDSLIHAGELEAALADAASQATSLAACVTDALALHLCTGTFGADDPERVASRIETPCILHISPPEGFTYYALHPLDFARAADLIAESSSAFAVIGIRSIGTTLSAVTAAALRAQGKAAARITVRPSGHPYARAIEFTSDETRWIAEHDALGAQFLIVDEGPGRSGSTFLAVAEALRRVGLAAARITIIGSRQFDPQSLCAADALERWQQFRFISTTPGLNERFQNWKYLGSGDWRIHFFESEHEWPESWTQMERFKVLSPDGREFVKFEGMGRIGKEASERARVLARAGFSPEASNAGDGFICYAAVRGRLLRRPDLNATILERIARYCAFRVSEFGREGDQSSQLEEMLAYNLQEEFGRELKISAGRLSSTAVLTDGRMQPYEWIANQSGSLIKTDAISHGDNHFFPGPCGIAWDLAGSAIEWELGPESVDFLLDSFRRFSGVDVLPDFELYLLAYCVFRLGFCKMARSTVRGSMEEERLDFSYRLYRAKALALLNELSVAQ